MSLQQQIFSLRAALIQAKNQARQEYYAETSEDEDKDDEEQKLSGEFLNQE